MTTERARELLGDEINTLSDQEVISLIQREGELCDALLDVIVPELLTMQWEGGNNGSRCKGDADDKILCNLRSGQ